MGANVVLSILLAALLCAVISAHTAEVGEKTFMSQRLVGSVTAGIHGVGDGHSWPDYLFNFLNDTFPGQISSTNGAVPGTISSYMEACLNIHCPKETDIVLVEYSINDMIKTYPLFMNEYRRAYERLIRKLLAYPNNPAVILMHAYNWNGDPTGHFWTNVEREYMEFAMFYDLPSLSVKAACFHELVSGQEGYSVQPRMEDPDGLAGKSFFYDKVHPDSLTGSRAMGELAMHLMSRVQWEMVSGQGAPGADVPFDDVAELPPPMITGNYAPLSDKCFIGTLLQDTVVSAKGFEWLNDSKVKAPKYGYIATNPGDVLTIKLDTRASSKPDMAVQQSSQEDSSTRRLASTKKPPPDSVLVQIIHLRSYEGMGSALVLCKSGCQCKGIIIEGHQPSVHNSQLYLAALYVSQSEECIIDIIVNKPVDGRPTKVKIAGVIVSEEAGELLGAAETVHHIERVHTNALRGSGRSYDVRQPIAG